MFTSYAVTGNVTLNATMSAEMKVQPNNVRYSTDLPTLGAYVDDGDIVATIYDIGNVYPEPTLSIFKFACDRYIMERSDYGSCVTDMIFQFYINTETGRQYIDEYLNAFPWYMTVEEVSEDWTPRNVNSWVMTDGELPFQYGWDEIPDPVVIHVPTKEEYIGDDQIEQIIFRDTELTRAYLGNTIIYDTISS